MNDYLQDSDDIYLPKGIADVFLPLTSKHPDKPLSQLLLHLWLLKTLAEQLVLPPNMSTCKHHASIQYIVQDDKLILHLASVCVLLYHTSAGHFCPIP